MSEKLIINGFIAQYDPAHTISEINSYLKWKENNLPNVLSKEQMNLLDSGFMYTHGRDKVFRPLLILNPKVFVDLKVSDEDTIKASHFVLQYMLNHSKFFVT